MPQATEATAKPSLKALDLDQLPPYGFMPAVWEKVVRDGEPSDFWKGTRHEWDDFVLSLRDDVARSIWPVYRQGKGWDKGGVHANAGPMTALELDLMDEWRGASFRQAASLVDPASQAELFAAEDDAVWDVSVLRSCHGTKALDIPLGRMFEQLHARVGSSILTLKSHFQRPRPAVVAYLQGRSEWKCSYAKSSMSSAMVSGHAFLGCLFGCLVFSWLNANDEEAAKKHRAALQRCAIGIGDRRVLAGVHYPSDNVASWIVATRLVPAIVHDPKVPAFLLEALTNGGLVLDGLRAAAQEKRGGPLAAPLKAFDAALIEMRDRVPTI